MPEARHERENRLSGEKMAKEMKMMVGGIDLKAGLSASPLSSPTSLSYNGQWPQ